jgi:corrinoid protein of di/trimethylamine methyltransferase
MVTIGHGIGRGEAGPAGPLDLATLDDGELIEQIQDDLYDALNDEVADGVRILLERGLDPRDILDAALVEGMGVIGQDFRTGILFVPQVLRSAQAMKAGMEILRPRLVGSAAQSAGKVVIGTVKGDVHDIGKNLVAMMMEGGGFEVVDIGTNVDVEGFIAAIETHRPDVLAMSALLTTTMTYMKLVVDTVTEHGMRDDIMVMVGGAPLNEQFARTIGADAYCEDAAQAVDWAKATLANPIAGERGRPADGTS